MSETITCGEATMRLLSAYGVDTVFGIPGVHTLDFSRELAHGPIRHIQARNEQGAGFMADGYARASGRVGVALVISGPGVTNALTAIGQSWADSIPVLLLSSETATSTHGKGWGMLHEIPDQQAVTRPLTALSARASHPSEVPGLIAQAFTVFAAQRPRPVHISIPIDVLPQPVAEQWMAVPLPPRPHPQPAAIEAAAHLLRGASRPVIMVGGGASGAAAPLVELAERLGAVVVSSTAGKGIVPDAHPLCLSATTSRPEVHSFLSTADVVLAVGTELAETDSFVERLDLPSDLIRIDIDPHKMNDLYPAAVPIVADALPAVQDLLAALEGHGSDGTDRAAEVARIRATIRANLTESERRHWQLLESLRSALADDTIFMGDICQLVYTGAFGMPVGRPRLWSYPAGFCTLGCGLPNAIGAKVALPERDVVCLTGDGGIMFTVQELIVAAELGLPIPVVIWDNGGLKQIRDDMKARNIDLVGVDGRNPDFLTLASALGCHGVAAHGLDHAVESVLTALRSDAPTVITVQEVEPWLAPPT